jgi:hypothetical protein
MNLSNHTSQWSPPFFIPQNVCVPVYYFVNLKLSNKAVQLFPRIRRIEAPVNHWGHTLLDVDDEARYHYHP